MSLKCDFWTVLRPLLACSRARPQITHEHDLGFDENFQRLSFNRTLMLNSNLNEIGQIVAEKSLYPIKDEKLVSQLSPKFLCREREGEGEKRTALLNVLFLGG